MKTTVSSTLAAWAAIASGTIGLVAFVALMAFLGQRSISPEPGARLIQFHDGGAILQYLLLIPMVARLEHLRQHVRPP